MHTQIHAKVNTHIRKREREREKKMRMREKQFVQYLFTATSISKYRRRSKQASKQA